MINTYMGLTKVRQLESGKWEGKLAIGRFKGRIKYKNLIADTEEECLERIEYYKREYSIIDREKCAPSMTLIDWIKVWYEYFFVKNDTSPSKISTLSDIKRISNSTIANIPLEEISAGILQKYYAYLKVDGRVAHTEIFGKGLSESCIRRTHAIISSALEKAEEAGLILSNPAKKCRAIEVKIPVKPLFLKSELKRFFQAAKELGYYELFMIAFATAVNKSELVGIQWKDVIFKTGEIKIRRQVMYLHGEAHILPLKSKWVERSVVVPEYVLNILKTLKKKKTSQWVFNRINGKGKGITPLSSDSVATAFFKKTLDKAGLERRSFSALRNTFAVMALNNDMDVKTLSRIMGFASVKPIIYGFVPLVDKKKRSASLKIEKAIKGILEKTDCE